MIHALVIAGSYQQFKYWLWENRQCEKDYFYVNDWESCLGLRNLPILLVEQYGKSPVNPYILSEMIQDDC